MFITKPLDKELLLVLSGTMLDDTFDLVSRSRSISVDRTWIGMCLGGELVIWVLQPGSQKRSVDRDKTGGGKGNLDCIVISLGEAAEDLVWSHKDRFKFRELTVFWKAGGEDLNQVSNLVRRRGTAAFVGLLRHCNTTANEFSFDRIPESIGDHIRSEGGGRNNNSFFELRSETNAGSMRGGIPRSIDSYINSNLYRRNCRQPV